MKIPKKTGLIIYSYNEPNIGKPLSLLSSFIRIFQKGFFAKGKVYTHTAQTIVLNDELYVIDSDYDGVKPKTWENWKVGRSYLVVFDPYILTDLTEKKYIDRAMNKSGKRYGYEDIKSWIIYQISGRFKGETNLVKADDNMLCSYLTGYLYGFKNWWLRSPMNLYENRLLDCPNGCTILKGNPKDIIL